MLRYSNGATAALKYSFTRDFPISGSTIVGKNYYIDLMDGNCIGQTNPYVVINMTPGQSSNNPQTFQVTTLKSIGESFSDTTNNVKVTLVGYIGINSATIKIQKI